MTLNKRDSNKSGYNIFNHGQLTPTGTIGKDGVCSCILMGRTSGWTKLGICGFFSRVSGRTEMGRIGGWTKLGICGLFFGVSSITKMGRTGNGGVVWSSFSFFP